MKMKNLVILCVVMFALPGFAMIEAKRMYNSKVNAFISPNQADFLAKREEHDPNSDWSELKPIKTRLARVTVIYNDFDFSEEGGSAKKIEVCKVDTQIDQFEIPDEKNYYFALPTLAGCNFEYKNFWGHIGVTAVSVQHRIHNALELILFADFTKENLWTNMAQSSVKFKNMHLPKIELTAGGTPNVANPENLPLQYEAFSTSVEILD